jgi:Glycosyl hydrolase family 57
MGENQYLTVIRLVNGFEAHFVTYRSLDFPPPQSQRVTGNSSGVRHYEEVFGKKPRGFWLPECGYYPGVGEVLKDFGIQFIASETHGIIIVAPYDAELFGRLFPLPSPLLMQQSAYSLG